MFGLAFFIEAMENTVLVIFFGDISAIDDWLLQISIGLVMVWDELVQKEKIPKFF